METIFAILGANECSHKLYSSYFCRRGELVKRSKQKKTAPTQTVRAVLKISRLEFYSESIRLCGYLYMHCFKQRRVTWTKTWYSQLTAGNTTKQRWYASKAGYAKASSGIFCSFESCCFVWKNEIKCFKR